MGFDASDASKEPSPLAHADRRFGRSLVVGLGVVAMITSAGPVLSYRSDVAISRFELQRRVDSEASIAAESLSLHLELLQDELERVSQRPEVDLHDGTLAPEQSLLILAHHDSVLFSGVALFHPDGSPVWAEPRDLFSDEERVLPDRWFQQVLKGEARALGTLRPGKAGMVMAVPVMRRSRLVGVIAGVIHASDRLLPVGLLRGEEVVVIGPDRSVLFPSPVPAWAMGADFAAELTELGTGAGPLEGKEWPSPDRLVSARHVGKTGLWLVLVSNVAHTLGRIRERFLLQLGFTGALQLVTLLLVTLYVRGNYRRFRQVDLEAAEQQKLAALGSAAALIAHEVKNSLNGLHAATATLSMGGDASLSAGAIRGQVDRLGHLASSLLSFGKPAEARIREVQVDQSVEQTVESLRAHPEAAEVRIELSLVRPLVADADPFFLMTALDNLLRNAIEASVAAKDLGKLADPRVEVRAGIEAERVVVAIEDHAGGPPPAFEERLFVPFVTSKPRGIGLGLAMARRAVEQQGGSLSFERTATGSRFIVRLKARSPLPRETPSARAPGAPATSAPLRE